MSIASSNGTRTEELETLLGGVSQDELLRLLLAAQRTQKHTAAAEAAEAANAAASPRARLERKKNERLAIKARALEAELAASEHSIAEMQHALAVETAKMKTIERELKQADADTECALTMLRDSVSDSFNRAISAARPAPPDYTAQVAIVASQMLLRAMTAKLIERCGVRSIVQCESGTEIVERCGEQGERFEIILMDHQMTPMDGAETTRLLRTLGIGSDVTAIVGLTGDLAGKATLFLASGLDAVEGKPLQPHAWEEISAKYLGR